MFPRYSLGMWFTFTMIFYKCWTSVLDTGMLSLNLKIEKSWLKTVNGNLKWTATIKNYNFPHFQERISARIWNLAWLCYYTQHQGRGSCVITEQISDIKTLNSLQGRPVWIYFLLSLPHLLPTLLCKSTALFTWYKGINPGHGRRQEHAVWKNQPIPTVFLSQQIFLPLDVGKKTYSFSQNTFLYSPSSLSFWQTTLKLCWMHHKKPFRILTLTLALSYQRRNVS